MWKSVGNFSGPGLGQADGKGLLRSAICGLSGAGDALRPLSACSACAGDYEVPDRTAWTPDAEEDESNDEFPAQEA